MTPLFMKNPGHKRVTAFSPDSRHRRDFPVASAMREAGFVPLPRLWVREEDMAEIYAITDRRKEEVIRIRQQVAAQLAPDQLPDPVSDKEAAWAAFERQRQA